MSSFFTNPTIVLAAGRAEKRDFEFSALKIKSVSGTVLFRLDLGDWIVAAAGDVFEAEFGRRWSSVEFYSVAGGSVTVMIGRGHLGGSSGASVGIGGGVQATSGSPEGVLDAGNGQWAFDAATGSGYVNTNTSGTSGWVLVF